MRTRSNVSTASPAPSSAGDQQPNNVYTDVSVSQHSQGDTERAKVHWAWMADARGDAKKKAVQGIDTSAVRSELLDVVRMLSSSTVETQTAAPSFVMQQNNIRMETDRHRSIATQIGAPKQKANKALQVVEADVVRTLRGGAVMNLYAETQEMQTETDEPAHAAGTLDTLLDDDESLTHSHYRPVCDVSHEAYPVYMSDARAQGIANKYGYISLPRHIVQLPPRRRKKFISPTEVSFLYGVHELQLDDNASTHLNRALSLWSQAAGFVPKY